ncbi:MAG: hypothetical protein LBQ86_06240 [Holophagales bacterium]|jgi:hypothetical protein|nr:hypothetical protein [Holophagales bacterium]
MISEDTPKTYEQCLVELKALADSGALDWALEREVNEGRTIEPSDLRFAPGFLANHFEIIRNASEKE